jgi:flavin-binding protein dodecin
MMMEAVRTSETSVDNHFTRQYMMMEAVCTSETSVDNHSTRQYMMMEAVCTSETSVDNHSTRQYIPEDNSEHHFPMLIYVMFLQFGMYKQH